MFSRIHPAWFAFGGSVVLLAVLIGLLNWGSTASGPDPSAPPLIVHCAASQRVPLEDIAKDYQKETGQAVELRFGNSQHVLSTLEISGQGDLFLPADEIYIEQAKAKGLLAEVLPLAKMTAVLVTRPDFDKAVAPWETLLNGSVRIGQANPDGAAIGKLTRDRLVTTGQWEALKQRTTVFNGTVTEVVNAVKLGNPDAGIVWDAVAAQYPDLKVVHLPELERIAARVLIGVVKSSPRPTDALRFARFVAAKDKGLIRFRERGFTILEEGDASAAGHPEIVLYAGSMLRPAIEKTIDEFKKREGVEVLTIYNGCGILVGQMKTGARPDAYFACDPRFMSDVRDLFQAPDVVSSNQLVIAVPKGNPHDLKTLSDLGKPGLKVGVGHEQQCALGAITKETFLQTGVYAAVRKNVAVESPTGDLLINKLRVKSLDVVVAYRSNVLPHADEIDAIPVKDIPCAAPQQPIAVSRSTAHPQLVKRLLDAIRSAESRERFEKSGFGWELKP